jgi:hypothetical protein
MRKCVRRLRVEKWLTGLALLAVASFSGTKATAETFMETFMPSIGVPTTGVTYFGWNPIGSPSALDASYQARWNFGMAMYEYQGNLRFTFVNGETSSPELSTIFTSFLFDDGSPNENGVYFNGGVIVQDDPLGPPVQWTSSTGVNFTSGGGNFPDGNTLLDQNNNPDPFNTTDSISWIRSSGQGYNVNSGVNAIPEYVTFNYSFVGTNTFGSVRQAFVDRLIRIGTHVQGLDVAMDMNSESILWTPVVYDDVPPPPGPLAPVPVPAAAGLGFLGMALIGVMRRKKS